MSQTKAKLTYKRGKDGHLRRIKPKPVGYTKAMRRENDPDYYPTQPWATRALFEHVLKDRNVKSVWEPACGGGHMVEVMREYNVPQVFASDFKDYGYGQVHNFLKDPRPNIRVDWIITNPPFSNDRAERFAIKALSHPGVIGVAMLVRTAWLEGQNRYERLFSKYPLSQVAILTDRIGLTEGTCDVYKNGMMPYSWFIWDLGSQHIRTLSWVPPGSKKELTKPDDQIRFGHSLVRRRET